MGRVEGRVALVTGGGRGQGRSHAVTLAREGADIVICDAPGPMPSVAYPSAGVEDMVETVRLVASMGRRCVSLTADVRDADAMGRAVSTAMEEFGHLDILCANAGICTAHEVDGMSDSMWREMIDVNLNGVFHAVRAVLPVMKAQSSGRIIATASMAGRAGFENLGHYTAAKWGVIGLIKSVALEVASFGITANAICPAAVNTPMMRNQAMYRLFRPDLENPTLDDCLPAFKEQTPMRVPWVEPEDISNAVLYLASDAARFVTGTTLSVAAGAAATMV
jgi:SDR family mycofactocin-dependent oxidoreductase